MQYILTFDIGTTAVKTCIFDESLACVSSANEEYALITKAGNIVELDPEVYWQAVKNGIAQVAPTEAVRSQIAAVCITTQGETLIPVDREGNPLRNAIVWLDTRSEEEAVYINTLPAVKDVYSRTGVLTVDGVAPLSKLLWIKEHEPEVYGKTHKFLLLEDYIILQLTGEFASEKGVMSSSAYYDIRSGELFRPILEQAGLDPEKIPKAYHPGDIIAGVSQKAAEQTGLLPGTPVVAGAMDQITAAIGGGNLSQGVVTETTGTCMTIITTADESCFNQGSISVFPHVLPGKYYANLLCMTAGVIQKWFKDEFCAAEQEEARKQGKSVYEILGQLVADCEPGANGLLMIPYLNGILHPQNKPDMRGVFFGMTLDTKKPQFLRAIYEGVGFMLRENLEIIEAMGNPVEEIRSFGGGSKSEVWQQIKADITGKRICTMSETECTSLGAAMLAAVALGLYPDIAAASVNRISRVYEPRKEYRELYDKLYGEYKNLVEMAESLFINRKRRINYED